jgi:hypothetical protein
MDDFIDHSYDSVEDPIERISFAVGSAKSFLGELKEGKLPIDQLSAHANHNITWASQGFLSFYWSQNIEPILRTLRIAS